MTKTDETDMRLKRDRYEAYMEAEREIFTQVWYDPYATGIEKSAAMKRYNEAKGARVRGGP